MINIFIIEDHPIFINGLRSLLENYKNEFNLCGVSSTSVNVMKSIEDSLTDIVLLDLKMPTLSGVELCGIIKEKTPKIKVIALTGETDPYIIYKTWENKADAILLKFNTDTALIDAIYDVLQGKRVLGSGTPDFSSFYSINKTAGIKLTKREKLILTLLSKGIKRSEVAHAINSNSNAVNFHCKNIFAKFGENNLISVIQVARREGLIS